MLTKLFNNYSKLIVKNGQSNATKLASVLSQSSYSTGLKSSSLPGENKVVIVGAGLAGLSAADHLIKNGITDLLILEASDRYGGRVHTVEMGGAICELGSKWLNFNQNPDSVFSLAKNSNLIDRDSFENNTENFFLVNRETMDEELVQLTSMLFRDLIKDAEKYLAEEAPIGYRTIDTYLKGRISKILEKMRKDDRKTAQQVFDVLLRNLSCQLGSDLGYVHVKHLGNLAKHFDKPVFIKSGLDQIFNKLVNKIPVDRLLLGKPVDGIRWSNLRTNEKPYVTCMDGSKYSADHIICTMPLGALSAFSQYVFSPKLPDTKIDAINKLGRGSPGKIYLNYSEPVTRWFIGSIMLGVPNDNSTSRDNWTSGISEISILSDSKNVLEVKVGGSYNETVERCSAELVERDVTETLRTVMKNDTIPRPSDIVRSFWSTDARSLCGLPFISIGSSDSSVFDLAAPLRSSKLSQTPRLLFAGDATYLEGFGTLEGARLSGIREAKRIVDFHK